MPRLRWILLALSVASCGDATAPVLGPAGLSIVAGNNVTDTAFAVLAQALLVEVRDNGGRPVSGTEVRFIGMPPNPSPGLPETFSRTLDGFMREETVDTTDGFGRARVQVQLGPRAGNARLVVRVSSTSAVDTARFTVLPGNPKTVLADAQDTTVTAGGGFKVGVRVADRWGNVRTDAVNFAASGAGMSVSAAGDISTTVPARGYIVATSGALADTTYVSAVPSATFAAVLLENIGDLSLVTLKLDGTGLQKLTTLQNSPAKPSWHPSGNLIVYEQETGPGITEVRLFVINMQGQKRRGVADAQLAREQTGHFSPDGQWLYFDGEAVSYRVRLDGNGLERVPTPPGLGSTWGPDASPDGVHLAVSGVAIQNLAGTTVTRLPVAGSYPRYSPDGTRFLYNGQGGALSVMNVDGTNAHELVSVHSYDAAIPPSWSADGNWILIRGPSALELVRVSNGEIIPLPYSGGLYQPSLKR